VKKILVRNISETAVAGQGKLFSQETDIPFMLKSFPVSERRRSKIVTLSAKHFTGNHS